MPYTTRDQLIEQFGLDEMLQLADPDGTGVVSDVALLPRIQDAEFLINAYAAPRYAVPLDQAIVDSSPIPRVCGDLVRYALMHGVPTDESRRRHDDAMRFLRDLQAGKVTLGAQDTEADATAGRVVVAPACSNTDWESY